MPTLTLVISLVSTAVGVQVSSRRGAEAIAVEVGAQVTRAVAEACDREVSPPLAGRECRGNRRCLRALAARLGPHGVVVGVDTGRIADSVAVHLEAVAADADEPLASADAVFSSARWREQLDPMLTSFARSLAAKLTAPEPYTDAAADAPRAVTLIPAPPLVEAVAVERPARSGRRAVGWVFAGAAVATAASGAGLLALGLDDRARVMGALAEAQSIVPRSELEARAASGNAKLTGAVICGVVAVAVAAISAALLASP